ncbi:ABC transporter permease [Micromonospora chersina]
MSDPSTASLVSAPHLEGLSGTESPDAGPPAGAQPDAKPRGLVGDAWHDLRRNPLFWISATFIVLFVVMAAFPSLFTSGDPINGVLSRSRVGPSSDGWFGFDLQGRDVYARTIYGARASIVVALLSTVGTLLFGGALGMITGYRGGRVDSLLSRLADVFFGLPFMLGALVILTTFNGRATGTTANTRSSAW